MDLLNVPKCELHCHIDGSLDLETSLKLLNEMGENCTLEGLKKAMTVEPGCTSLADYLDKFTLPISILQTERALEESAYAVVKNAALENVKYLEARFAPTSHRQKGLNFNQIIEATLRGMRRAEQEFDIKTGLIACAMRGLSDDENIAMFKAAREYLGEGLVACDIAGNEAAYPAKDYVELFEAADDLGLPYTIHAGECGSAENVADSISMGAKRIGHGIACVKDREILQMVAYNEVGLEICPTSNLQTKTIAKIEDFPIMQLWDAGVRLCVNTDNRTVSGITLTHEFELLAKTFNLTERDFKEMFDDAMEMRF